ncbi:MAG: transcriptional repressor [Flavobacteriales bacterium]|nr:transcriptional repressor [Flavobacteriales bacterium]
MDELLKRAGLKVTPTRRLVLQVFKKHSFALSYNDIEGGIKEKLDKVTIYRTLKSFEEKGITHQILDTSNQVKYALCGDSCSDHEHHDAHLHFKCTSCEQTYCIEDSQIPQISLPKGFVQRHSSMLVEGICKTCNRA